jgi:hypothetical protein
LERLDIIRKLGTVTLRFLTRVATSKEKNNVYSQASESDLHKPQQRIHNQSHHESHLEPDITRGLGNRADIPYLVHARYRDGPRAPKGQEARETGGQLAGAIPS